MPMDETLAVAAIDLGGRPHAVVDLKVTVRARRRSADRAGARFLRGLRHRRARQRAREGAVRPLEPSPDRGGVQGVRPRAARRRARRTSGWRGCCRARRGCCDRACIDYKAGNLTSVRKALAADRRRGVRARRAGRSRRRAAAIIVPGVGHFGATRALDGEWIDGDSRAGRRRAAAARHLPRHAVAVRRQRRGAGAARARPALGHVLSPGLQRLCSEHGRPGAIKIPHVGWNSARHASATASIVDGIATGAQVYFTHSYVAPVTGDTVAVTEHGEPFAAGRAARPDRRRAVPSGEIGRRRTADPAQLFSS